MPESVVESSRVCPECGDLVVPATRLGPHISAHRRADRARYFYDDEKDPHHKRPLVRRDCDQCGTEYVGDNGSRFCSKHCSQVGANNSVWRGNAASYSSCHSRVYRERGSAFGCTVCGSEDPNERYEWANLTGDYPNVHDYASMCKPCHAAYDNSRRPDGGRLVYTDQLLDEAEHLRQTMTLTAVAATLGVSLPNLCTRLRQRRSSTEGVAA